MDFPLSQRAHLAAEQPISELMAEALKDPGLISLAAGFVDEPSLPTREAVDLLRSLLDDPALGRAALQYGTTRGDGELRRLVFAHVAALDRLSPEDMVGSPESVIVTTGSQQLLHILTDLLVDPGDIVVCGWPSYFVYTGALPAFGGETRGVELDEGGMRPEALEAVLAALHRDGQLRRVKIVYVCSYHQNPTGLTLAADRRAALLDVVRRYSAMAGQRILLIEDAAYRELTYDGDAPPSIKRHDRDDAFVAYCGTFSKPFAPGLKTGYGLLPRDLVDAAILNKGGRDFGSPNLCQALLREALRTGAFAAHVGRLRGLYRAKRDAMLRALEEGFAGVDGVSWTRPAGGLYVWLTLPVHIDTGRRGPLFDAALREGVLFVPGGYCYPPDPTRRTPRNTIRLSFGVADETKILNGVARLARAVRAAG